MSFSRSDRGSMLVPAPPSKILRPEIGAGLDEPSGSGNPATRNGGMLSSDQLLSTFQDPGNYIDDMRNISINYLSREVLQVIDDELHQLTMVHFGESDDIGVLARIYTPMPLSWSVDVIRLDRSTITAPMTRQVGSQQHGNTLTESKTGIAVNTKRNIKELVFDLDLEFLDAWLARKSKYLAVVTESFAIDYKTMIYQELLSVPKVGNKTRASEKVWLHEYIAPYFRDFGCFNRGGNKIAESLICRAEEEMHPNTRKKPTNMIITHRMASASNFSPAMLYQENGPSAGAYVRAGRNALVMDGGATAVMCSIRDQIEGKNYIVTQEVWNGDLAISMEDPFAQSLSFYSFKNDRYNTFTTRHLLHAFTKVFFSGEDASDFPRSFPRTTGKPSKPGPFLNVDGYAHGMVGNALLQDEGGEFDTVLREWIRIWMADPSSQASKLRIWADIMEVNYAETFNARTLTVNHFTDAVLGEIANVDASHAGLGAAVPHRTNAANYPTLAFAAADFSDVGMSNPHLVYIAVADNENRFGEAAPDMIRAQYCVPDIAAMRIMREQALLATSAADVVRLWYLSRPMNRGGLESILNAGLPLPFALGAFSYNLLLGDTAILAADNIGFSFMSEIKVNTGNNIEGIQEITRAQHKSGIITTEPEAVYRATCALIIDARIAAGREFVEHGARIDQWHEETDRSPATVIPFAIGYTETHPTNKLTPTFRYGQADERVQFHDDDEDQPDAAYMFSKIFEGPLAAIKSSYDHNGNEWNGETGHHRLAFLAERVTVDVKSSLGNQAVTTREFESTFPSYLRNGSRDKRFAKVPLSDNQSTTISIRS